MARGKGDGARQCVIWGRGCWRHGRWWWNNL